MLNLKLAEYSAEGKFERFLELDSMDSNSGKTFCLASDYIEIFDYDNIEKETYCRKTEIREIDEKDPLNRFDGLFDGRTYGNGRFVLLTVYKYENQQFTTDDLLKLLVDGCVIWGFEDNKGNWMDYERDMLEYSEVIGNIHQHPELWEKIR